MTTLLPVPIERSSKDERVYHSFTLSNHLTCLVISDPATDKGSAALDINIGQYSDTADVQGMAHFLEHMLFMGTTKYPDENDYNKYLNAHGGNSNAYTDLEHTNYYLDVACDHLEGALDRFAQFFVAPLLKEDSVDRERQAVDSEHAKNLQSDYWRSFQLVKNQSRPDHPYVNFGSGNSNTLQIDGIRDKVHVFYEEHYSANRMKLVVYGKEDIQQLQSWVESYFEDIPNKNYPDVVFPGDPFAPETLPKLLSIVPVRSSITLELLFPMCEVDSMYLSKPTRYLSHLLGHEGEGSILSLLKEKSWAHDLSAGESKSCSDWAQFSISLTLTEAGLEAKDQVMECIFAYLNLLKQVGPQEWIHHETATVADISFQFLSQQDPMDYTSALACKMHQFPMNHVLSGSYRIYEYSADNITKCLSYFRPDNLMVLLSSKDVDTDQIEPWYGTEYSSMNLDANLVQALMSATVETDWMKPIMRLPDKNDMIPTDFDVYTNTTLPKDQPTLAMDTPTCRLWYKPDNCFSMPKVNFLGTLTSPASYDSPVGTVLTSLFCNVLTEQCNEFTYLASMAGLHSSLTATRAGIELHMSGYSHKMDRLLARIVQAMLDLTSALTQDLTDRLVNKLKLQLENFAVSPPYQHAMYGADLILLETKWTTEQKLEALASVTTPQLVNFYTEFLQRFHLEALVHGNVSPEKAKELTMSLMDALKPAVPFSLPSQRVVQLPTGQEIVYRFEEYNPDNTNSCLEVIFQMGSMTLGENAVLALVHHLIKEPAFNELRTEEQLGYLVHSGIHTGGNDIKGLLLLIQSDAYDPIHLDARIDAFLERFRTTLVNMTDDDYAQNVNAVVNNFLEQNKNLGEESTRYWDAITKRNYMFQKYQHIADHVKVTTKMQVLIFWDRYITKGSPHRTKLGIQVFSKARAELMETPVNAGVILVKDTLGFKRGMSLFPLSNTVDVEAMRTEQYTNTTEATGVE